MTIATHISVMSALAFLSVVAVGGDERFVYESILALWPIDFPVGRDENNFLKLALTAIVLALIVNLRKDLVAPSRASGSPAALSIYPDPATYVDDDGYEAGVTNLISSSNGGVVGITGVRGAGKSALLSKLRDRFDQHHCVVWTVAPVSHRGGDDLSFLLSVCRTLCQKVIDDLNEVLFGKRNTLQMAGEEFLRRIRVPGVLLAIIVSSSLLLRGPGGEAPILFGDRLPTPPAFRLGGNEIDSITPNLHEHFQEALNAERLTIRRLNARITEVLPEDGEEQDDKVSTKSYAIVPLVRHGGFDLVGRDNTAMSGEVLLGNHNWLAEDVRQAPNWEQVKSEFENFDRIYNDQAVVSLEVSTS